MLRIAIQSKGRLNEDTLRLLAEGGIKVGESKRALVTRASGFPLEVLYLRDDDIPQAVAMGVAHIGIVGLNEVMEKNFNVTRLMDLGFGKCRLSIALPNEREYSGPHDLDNRRIATSYPGILGRWLDDQGVKAHVHQIEGSVEIAPAIGISDAIFDIVSSGATLVSNGLKEVESVMDSEAVLIANPELSDELMQEVDDLMFRFRSILESRGMKYVLMNIPKSKTEEAIAILPGMRSPTILPLAQEEWCSIHAVIADSELWDKIKQLKAIGAEGILILSLENMVR